MRPAQGKALDAFEAALKADRKSEDIAKYMVQSHDDKTTAPAVADRIERILKEVARQRHRRVRPWRTGPAPASWPR